MSSCQQIRIRIRIRIKIMIRNRSRNYIGRKKTSVINTKIGSKIPTE